MNVPREMFLLAARAGLAALKEARDYSTFGGDAPQYIRAMTRLTEAIGDCSVGDVDALESRLKKENEWILKTATGDTDTFTRALTESRRDAAGHCLVVNATETKRGRMPRSNKRQNSKQVRTK